MYLNNAPATVKYIGPVEYLGAGIFIGLEMIDKEGECDGSFAGRQYFNCLPRKGVFVKFKQLSLEPQEDDEESEL